MSGDIIDGIDQLLNQDVEDITPFYQKTEKPKIKDFDHENYSFDEYTLELEVLLQLILGCLALLVIIVLIIGMIVRKNSQPGSYGCCKTAQRKIILRACCSASVHHL